MTDRKFGSFSKFASFYLDVILALNWKPLLSTAKI